ncbi:MAG TPA: thioredoxin-disulfide reductase [Bacteroidales bacterium]|nr:thioredoxin-disulfide reductase [Bacteroidales bacterium]
MEKVRCLIIGSGPAGYTAAIYAARADMSPVLYTGIQPGGQLTTTNEVDNFPGYPAGIPGPQLMEDLQQQASRFNTDIRMGIVTRVDLSDRPFHVVADDGAEILAETLIVATGATARYLGLPSEHHYKGRGVSACATCDGFFYRGQDVAVVGGGDTAAEEATYLARMCRRVFLIHRRNELRASKAMQHRVMNTPNLEVIWDHVPVEVLGDTRGVNGVMVENVRTGMRKKLDIQGFFVAIGHVPNTDLFKDQLTLDQNGYVITAPDSTRTSVEGVFACGDVQDHVFRQAVTAAGTGCMAALEAERFLASLES